MALKDNFYVWVCVQVPAEARVSDTLELKVVSHLMLEIELGFSPRGTEPSLQPVSSFFTQG